MKDPARCFRNIAGHYTMLGKPQQQLRDELTILRSILWELKNPFSEQDPITIIDRLQTAWDATNRCIQIAEELES